MQQGCDFVEPEKRKPTPVEAFLLKSHIASAHDSPGIMLLNLFSLLQRVTTEQM